MTLTDALAAYRAAERTCPYQSASPPPSSQDCKTCGANAGEACRRMVIAAFDVVDAAKAIEAQRAETTKIGSVEDESAVPKGFAQKGAHNG